MKLLNYSKFERGILVENDDGLTVRIEAWTKDILRISCTNGNFNSDEIKGDLVVANPENTPYTLTDSENALLFSTDNASISIRKATFEISLLRKGEVAVKLSRFGMKLWDTEITTPHYITDDKDKTKLKLLNVDKRDGYRFHLSFNFKRNEKIYGLGQSVSGALDRKTVDTHLYQNNNVSPSPTFVSSLGYGILINAECWSSFRLDEYGYTFCADKVDFGDWFFIASNNVDGAIRGFRHLTGNVPMMPKWLFGYVQCREHYHTQKELLDVLHEFRESKIPLDLIIQDWNYWSENTWSDKSFDSSRYPSPSAMCKEVHDNHAHIMISVWPNTRGGKSFDELAEKNQLLADGGVYGDGGVYNVFDEGACDTYWSQLEKGIFNHGFDAWWCDSSEPFEPQFGGFREPDEQKALSMGEYYKWFDSSRVNVFSLLHCRNIYEHQRKVTDKKRVVNLTRSGYIGQQRFSGMVWSGDPGATFEELKRHVAEGLSFCASGLPYWTNDIGGFHSFHGNEYYNFAIPYTSVTDRGYFELYTRWFEFATFLPVLRSHGTGRYKEVWQFGKQGEPFYDALIKFINIRYTLIPYIYSTAWQVTKNADTFIRLLAFDFPYDDKALECDADSYMFGRYLLVSPVTKPMYFEGADTELNDVPREQEVYLPSGYDWYDYFTEERFGGGQTVTVQTPIDKIPVFVKSGAIIPTTCVMQYVDEIKDAPYTLNVYTGSDGKFTIYEDSDDGYDYEKGEYAEYDVEWKDGLKELTISARRGSFKEMVSKRTLNIRIIGGKTTSVVYDGTPIKLKF